jgi:hypothetical protein
MIIISCAIFLIILFFFFSFRHPHSYISCIEDGSQGNIAWHWVKSRRDSLSSKCSQNQFSKVLITMAYSRLKFYDKKQRTLQEYTCTMETVSQSVFDDIFYTLLYVFTWSNNCGRWCNWKVCMFLFNLLRIASMKFPNFHLLRIYMR